MISIHALREEGDMQDYQDSRGAMLISIHALREEGDAGNGQGLPGIKNFYPRPPRGGRPRSLPAPAPPVYFYPRPPRGGRRCVQLLNQRIEVISIHALREEGDSFKVAPGVRVNLFLSTPSARRATCGV